MLLLRFFFRTSRIGEHLSILRTRKFFTYLSLATEVSTITSGTSVLIVVFFSFRFVVLCVCVGFFSCRFLLINFIYHTHIRCGFYVRERALFRLLFPVCFPRVCCVHINFNGMSMLHFLARSLVHSFVHMDLVVIVLSFFIVIQFCFFVHSFIRTNSLRTNAIRNRFATDYFSCFVAGVWPLLFNTCFILVNAIRIWFHFVVGCVSFSIDANMRTFEGQSERQYSPSKDPSDFRSLRINWNQVSHHSMRRCNLKCYTHRR